MYLSNERGSDLSGREPVMENRFQKKLFVSASGSGICCAVPRII